MTKAKDARERDPDRQGSKSGREGDEQAVVSMGQGERLPQSRGSELPEIPEFVPLVDSFREYMEDERSRQRQRVLGLTALFLVVLVLFAIGPLYLGRTFLHRADATFRTQEQALQAMTASINRSVSTLAVASDELRKALELQQELLAKVGAAEGVPPQAVAASLPPPAVSLPSVPAAVAVTPPPAVPATNAAAAAPAAPLPPSPAPVVAVPEPPVVPAAVVAVAPSAPVAPAPAAVVPPVTPVPAPVVAAPVAAPTATVAVAAAVTSAAPVTVVMPGLPATLGGSTNVADLLREIEARISALRQGNEVLIKRLDGATATGNVGQATSAPRPAKKP